MAKTVADVMSAPAGPERDDAIHAWCASVWSAFGENQPAIAELLHRLARMTVQEIRALPSMHPGRADVITGGALIEARVAARLSVQDLIVSESDILDGIALQLMDQ